MRVKFGLLCLLSGCCHISTELKAQTGWQNWEKIYSDSDITVEVQFFVSATACDPDSDKPFMYRGRITGRYKTRPTYVNFKTAYTDCNGDLGWRYGSLGIWNIGGDLVNKFLLESADYSFTASNLNQAFYEVTLETSKLTGTGTDVQLESRMASDITGKRQVVKGESTRLSVKGGELGIGSDWYWYEDNCGSNFIGKGNSIMVSPGVSTKYFVRAESQYRVTNCVSASVEVFLKSVVASSIEGPSDFCLGRFDTLAVSGGYLGSGAKWVWYEGECGGYEAIKVGEGERISVSPATNTTYYVRAESPYDATDCISKQIRILSESSAPSQIIANPSDYTICQSTPLELTVKGGKLAADADWVWYADACGNNRIGSGTSIRLEPTQSTVYYVRAEGKCRNTICISHKQNVMEASSDPSSISLSSEKIFRGKKTVLSVEGGKLGEGAVWRWYEGSCGSTKLLASGPKIAVKPRKNTVYLVRAEGICNMTNCTSRRIEPLRRHKWTNRYIAGDGVRKILHFGFGGGLSYYQQERSVVADFFDYDGAFLLSAIEPISFSNLAATGQMVFHPVMKEGLAIGLNASGSFGIFLNNDRTNYDVDYYFKRINIGSEFVLGTRPLKFVLKLDRSVQPDNFYKSPRNDYFYTGYTTYTLNNTFRSEMISGGLRLGRYSREARDKSKANIDLLYTLCRYHENSLVQINRGDYSFLGDWYTGLGMEWWVQSRYRLRFDLQFNIRQADMNWAEPNFSNSTFNLSLLVNKDFFY